MLSSCNKNNIVAEPEPPLKEGTTIRVVVNDDTFTATLYDNATANAFRTLLPLTIKMSEINGNEKYYELPHSLPTANIRPSTISNGDIMLYGSRTLVLFYLTFSTSYSYTPIGKIDNPTGLKEALGRADVIVKFE